MGNEAECTYHGYISSTHDALLVFECVRRGIMPKIKRRLRDDERKMIRSGQVFVFDERESGIKRWTDGLLWSPSRILMNFLIYRQIDKRQAATRAAAEVTSMPQQSMASRSSTLPFESDLIIASAPEPNSSRLRSVSSASDSATLWRKPDDAQNERNLVGSLTSSYPFARGGLCKKTISIQIDGSAHHLISYYTVDDVRSGRLRTPSSLPEIASLSIAPSLLAKTSFRFPPAVSIGPDGVPRFRPEEMESFSSSNPSSPHLLHQHDSSGEGTSSGSGSESRRAGTSGYGARVGATQINSSSAAAQGAAAASMGGSFRRRGVVRGSNSSASLARNAPLAHQIGGSGAFMPTRRSSEFNVPLSTHRYGPYGYPAPATSSLHGSSDSSNTGSNSGNDLQQSARTINTSSSMPVINFASALSWQSPYAVAPFGNTEQQELPSRSLAQAQAQMASQSLPRPSSQQQHHQHHHSAPSPLYGNNTIESTGSPSWAAPPPILASRDFGVNRAPSTASFTNDNMTSLDLGGLAAFSAVDEPQQQSHPIWPGQQNVPSMLSDETIGTEDHPAPAGIVYGIGSMAWTQQPSLQTERFAQVMEGPRGDSTRDAYALPLGSPISSHPQQQQHSFTTTDGQYQYPPFRATSSQSPSIGFPMQLQQQHSEPIPVHLHTSAQAGQSQLGQTHLSISQGGSPAVTPTSAPFGTVFLQKTQGYHPSDH